MSKNEKKQYSINDMMNHIIEKNNLKDLLETCQIAKLIKIHGIQHYKKDDNRHGADSFQTIAVASKGELSQIPKPVVIQPASYVYT